MREINEVIETLENEFGAEITKNEDYYYYEVNIYDPFEGHLSGFRINRW